MRFIVDKNTPLIVEAFSTIGEVEAIDTSAFTRERVKDAEALIVRSEVKVGPALLEGSRVQIVGTTTIGTDHLDEHWLKRQGIAFVNAPGSNANSVCEYVLAAMLVYARRRGIQLKGRTIGVIGVGNVGSRVRKMAETIGMIPVLNDPPLARVTGDPVYRPLEDALSADVVTLHVPLTKTGPDATFHLLDKRTISALKMDALLINTSRGGVVETGALRNTLHSKSIGGAILDVWENEPAFDPELLRLADIGTPHIAGYSLDGKTNAVRMVYDAVCALMKVQQRWSLDPEKLPDAVARELTLSPYWRGTEEELGDLVARCYDILQDDRALRGTIEGPSSERGGRFQKLRTGYRVRREFVATTVRGVSGGAAEQLGKLGFNLIRQ